MPPLAVMAAPLIAGITLEGLAIGATIVGTGMQIIGKATDNKTLSKIGTGFSMAGGVGLGVSSIGGMMGKGAMAAEGAALSGADDVAAISGSKITSTAKDLQGFKSFTPSGGEASSMGSFLDKANKVGSGSGITSGSSVSSAFNPELEKNFFERANNTLANSNTLSNMLGGAGDAYVANEKMDLERELTNKKLGLEQQLIDMKKKNTSTPLNMGSGVAGVGLQRNLGVYQPLLKRTNF